MNMGVDPFSIEALDGFDLQQGQDAKNRLAFPPLCGQLLYMSIRHAVAMTLRLLYRLY